MKSLKRMLCVILSALVVLTMPLEAFAEVVTKSPFTSRKYTHQSKFDDATLLNGVDLSEHNGTVDFAKLKAAGVNFVFLRLGVRGYASEGNMIKDAKFDEYYKLAMAEGLSIGAYFYSQALNKTEAVAEAEKALSILNGRKLDLPIAFDYEFANYNGRLDKAWREGKINRDKMTNNTIAFCEKIKSAGYQPMVYASKYFFYDNLNYKTLEDKGYQIWLAHYTDKTDYEGSFNAWQYSESGTVDGVNGNVDCNFMYQSPNVELGTTRIVVEDVDKTSAYLSWDGVENADGYEIIQIKNNATTIITSTVSTSALITALTPATNYYFRVRAYKFVNGAKAYASNGPSKKVTTLPEKVTGLKVVDRTDKAITLTWNKLGSPTSYNVYKYDAEKKQYVLIKNATSNTTTVSNLTPNKLYSFKVEAVKNELIGPVSDKISYYTRPEAPAVRLVESPRAKRIRIKWYKNSSNAGYQVQYSRSKDFSENYKTVTIPDGLATSATVTTAYSNCYYSIRVRGYIIRNGSKVYTPWSKAHRLKVK